MKQACKIVLMKIKKKQTENETFWWMNHTGKKNIWSKKDLEILLIGKHYYGGRTRGYDRGRNKTVVPFSRQHPCCYKAVHCLEQPKNSLVSLCWTGCRPQTLPDFWPPKGFLAAGFSPWSGNLNPSNSSVRTMLMWASLDQHDLSTLRDPSLKPSLTCAS